MSPLRFAPVDIRGIVEIRKLGDLFFVARAIRYKGSSSIDIMVY